MIDQNNPGRWADGTPRSQNNGFDWRNWTLQADWSDVIVSSARSKTQAESVERMRSEGKTVGSIALMGRGPKQTAMLSIENRAAGERSRDRLAALRRSAI